MPHVELELSDSGIEFEISRPGLPGALRRWVAAVRTAGEVCLLLDADAVVVSCSAGFTELFGVPNAVAVGRHVGEGVLDLLDFTGDNVSLADWELDKTPPLQVLRTGTLARGLLRFRDRQG